MHENMGSSCLHVRDYVFVQTYGANAHSEMERQRNRAYALRKRHIRSTLRFEEIQRRIRNGRNRSEQDPQFLYCGAY